MMTETLFHSPHDALIFAFRCDYEQYGRSLMSRMADGPSRTGNGLGGLDGTAQAGLIGAMLSELPVLHRSILEARHCPKSFECQCGSTCCKGFRENPRYGHAISIIVMAVGPAAALSHYRLRDAIVRRYFGERKRIVQIGDECGVHRNTVSSHSNAILSVLKEQERAAYRVASEAIHSAGLVHQ